MSNKGNYKKTLCWDCANATNSGCSRSRALIPVEGWTAEKDTLKTNYADKDSYLVIDCPEFIPDGERRAK